mgnify:CR=1 FL=1
MAVRYPFGTVDFQRGLVEVAGTAFFVSSTHAQAEDSPSHGRTPEVPFATIDYAIGRCTANNGDIIFVMPGHVETISSATSLVFDIAGVVVIGLGQGRTRPILDFTNTAGSVEMDAANCRLSNVQLRANVSAVVVGINVDAHDVELDLLAWTFDATGDDFVTMIDVTTVNRTHIHDCLFESENAAGGAEAINLTNTADTRIENNTFRGNWSDAAIQNTTTLCTRLVIKGNVIYNSDTSVYNGIDVGTLSTTGIVANNRITALYATTLTKIFRDGDLTSMDNFFANDVSERGSILVPATSSV